MKEVFKFGKTVTTGQVELYVTQDSVQYVLDAYYTANKDQLSMEFVVPLDIEGLNIHAEFLVSIKAPNGPKIALAPIKDDEAVRRLAAKNRFPLRTPDSYVKATGDTNVALTLDNIDFAVYNYANGQKGTLIQQLVVNAALTGFICIEDNRIKIAAMDGAVTVGANQPQPDPIASILAQVLASALRDRFDDMPLPQMQDVLGAYPVLNRALITDQKIFFYVSVDTTYAQPVTGNLLRETNKVSLGGNVQILGSSNSTIVNELSDAFIKLPQFSQQSTSESDGFGIRAGLFAGISTPRLTISNGTATAFAEAGAYASLGVEACGEWAEVRISAGTIQVNVKVVLHISDDKKSGYLTFEPDKSSIHFSFGLDLPVPFNYVLSPISALLDFLVSEFGTAIFNAYTDIKLPLISFSEPLDIFSVPLDMKIDKFGVEGDQVVFVGTAT